MGFGQQENTNPNRDHEVQSPPKDGISCLAFSPNNYNFLVAGSWDCQLRLWQTGFSGASIQSEGKAAVNHEGPILCASWSKDGSRVFAGGCDNKARVWSLAQNTNNVFGQHAAPIKTIASLDEMGMVVTGGWDKTLKYWDLRQQNPAATIPLPERVYCMDVNYPLMVVATAERHVVIYDLKKPQQPYKTFMSPLKYMSRSLACFPDRTGFALGSIEGRVAIHHVEEKDNQKNFAFKCHRENNNIFAVNCIHFHPTYGTFATTGSDGTFNFWDKDSKQRLKPFPRLPVPVPCGAFNIDGKMFAYAGSYDWSKGCEYYNPQSAKNYILIHAVQDQEIKNRRPVKKR